MSESRAPFEITAPQLRQIVDVVWCVVHDGIAPAPDVIAHPEPTCDMFDGYVDDPCRLVPLYIKETDR